MKRFAAIGMLMLFVAFTVIGCATEPGQWEVSWDKTGVNNSTSNKNYQVQGGSGNGLF
ncbi:MAG: hypothetical protein ACOYNZ_20245 [Rhodoferax sp.]